MRLILLGNAGAGKSTMARCLIGSADIPRLSLDEIADSARLASYESALNIATFMKNSIQNLNTEIVGKTSEIKFHKIEWHRKFSLSLACLVLFFIGAPLGSIIRKGGMGMPLVVAIVFFLLFHLLNMFGEKFVKDDITYARGRHVVINICVGTIGSAAYLQSDARFPIIQ